MKMKRTQLPKQLNSAAAYSKFAAQAPAQAGADMVIRDVRIVEEGIAKGHGVWLDSNFIADTVRLAQNRRIKCRFGHPQMCGESLGKVLGYYDNFRAMSDENGAYAIADLHLLEVANASPDGKLADYILELSKVAPDMFGNSIVFSPSIEYYKTDKPGVKVYEDWWTGRLFDVDGNEYDEATHGKIDESKLYVDNEMLHESDLVDSPAATNSLFGQPMILTQVAEFFGLNIGGLRKTALFNKLVKSMAQTNKKFDINATTTDGNAIVIVTENSYINIGDSVQDSEGNAVADGDYGIAESDAQSNITISVVGGVITNIGPPMASAGPAQQEATPTPAAEFSAQMAKLQSKSNEIAEQLKQMAAGDEKTAKSLSRADLASFKRLKVLRVSI
jgi:hypothetical protein